MNQIKKLVKSRNFIEIGFYTVLSNCRAGLGECNLVALMVLLRAFFERQLLMQTPS